MAQGSHRLLKRAVSFVLGSQQSLTYPKRVRLRLLHRLRPCRTAILSSLEEVTIIE